jgi:hypothetical protein
MCADLYVERERERERESERECVCVLARTHVYAHKSVLFISYIDDRRSTSGRARELTVKEEPTLMSFGTGPQRGVHACAYLNRRYVCILVIRCRNLCACVQLPACVHAYFAWDKCMYVSICVPRC